MERDSVRDTILLAMAESLEAQARAVRRLQTQEREDAPRQDKGMSHTDMAYDILCMLRKPLHVSELLARIEKVHGVTVDRESLVSALAKRIAREDRFVRTGKNTFAARTQGR